MTPEDDFRELAAIILQRGAVYTVGPNDTPVRWRLRLYYLESYPKSPQGPYSSIKGPALTVYFRPDQSGIGHMKRLDFRDGGTPDRLHKALAFVRSKLDGGLQ